MLKDVISSLVVNYGYIQINRSREEEVDLLEIKVCDEEFVIKIFEDNETILINNKKSNRRYLVSKAQDVIDYIDRDLEKVFIENCN